MTLLDDVFDNLDLILDSDMNQVNTSEVNGSAQFHNFWNDDKKLSEDQFSPTCSGSSSQVYACENTDAVHYQLGCESQFAFDAPASFFLNSIMNCIISA